MSGEGRRVLEPPPPSSHGEELELGKAKPNGGQEGRKRKGKGLPFTCLLARLGLEPRRGKQLPSGNWHPQRGCKIPARLFLLSAGQNWQGRHQAAGFCSPGDRHQPNPPPAAGSSRSQDLQHELRDSPSLKREEGKKQVLSVSIFTSVLGTPSSKRLVHPPGRGSGDAHTTHDSLCYSISATGRKPRLDLSTRRPPQHVLRPRRSPCCPRMGISQPHMGLPH